MKYLLLLALLALGGVVGLVELYLDQWIGDLGAAVVIIAACLVIILLLRRAEKPGSGRWPK